MTENLKLMLLFAVIFITGSCHTQSAPKNAVLNGKWFIELNTSDIGNVRSFLNFEFGDSTFIAYTRKGADREILGAWKSTLGRLFTNDFKHGSLINITNGKVKHLEDTVSLSAIFRSALGSYYFKGQMYNGRLHATLLNRKNEVKGSISGSAQLPALPLCNYPGLIDKALQLTRNTIYKRSVTGLSEWKTFESSITARAKKMQDDVEMEFAFFYYASKLPFSHYSLLRLPPGSKDDAGPVEKQVLLTEKTPETMYMKIKTFEGTASEMDSAFSVIISRQYKNLVVDLRNNPGGNIAAGMSFATHLADTTFYGGVFLTQKWFRYNSGPPLVKDYNKLPHFTEANFDLVIEGIHKEEGLCLQVIPAAATYKGRLFILTNSGTASTCEPIVYGLRQNKRAVVIGERTAGAMLNGEFFGLDDGFSVIIPTADYYAADGYRVDREGVSPGITVDPAKALDYTMDLINKEL